MQTAIFIAEKSYIIKNTRPVYNKIKNELPYRILAWLPLAGHIMQFDEPKTSFSWDNVPYLPQNIMTYDFNNLSPAKGTKLYKPSRKVMGGKSGTQRYNAIADFLSQHNVDFVISAGDSDREGSLLAMEPLNSIGWDMRKTKRYWIKGGFTNEKVKHSLKNLLSLDYTFSDGNNIKHMYQASILRSMIDRILGYSFSPALSLKTASKVRAGRIKLPTLKLVVDNDAAIKNFVPKTYYVFQQDFTDQGKKYTGEMVKNGTKMRQTITDKEQAQKIKQDLENSKQGKIISVEQKKQAIKPPQFLKTNDVITAFLKKYSNGKQIMQGLERCYQSGILTYPRTNTRLVSASDAKTFPDLLKSVNKSIPQYQQYISQIDTAAINKRTKSKRWVDSKKAGAHEALVPTEKSFAINSLNTLDRDLMTYICGYFVQAFLPDQQVLKTDIITQNSNYQFITRGQVEKDPGWTILFNKKTSNVVLPAVANGDSVIAGKVKADKKQTTPPARYTQSSLISIMGNVSRLVKDKNAKKVLHDTQGLGTDTSQTNIVEGLLESKQLLKRGKKIYPSEGSIKLINALKGFELIDPIYTANFETRLSYVSKGQLAPEKYLQNVADYTTKECQLIKTSKTIPKLGTHVAAKETTMTYAGAPVKEGQGKYGPYWEVQISPKKRGFISKNIGGLDITPEILQKLLSGETLKNQTLKSRYGKTYHANLSFNKKTGKIDHKFVDENGQAEKDTSQSIGTYRGKPIIKRKGKWGPYFNCGKYNISQKWSSHLFTNQEIIDLLNNKKVHVKFKTRYGQNMETDLAYNKRKKKIVFTD